MTTKQGRRKSRVNQPRRTQPESELRIYNSLTKRNESFTPLEPGIIRMYTCGLTVNNLMHIGHARTYIFWDVVDRYLRYLGFDVIHVSNVTDIGVDDRILKRLQETGESFQQLIIHHTLDYFTDRRALGIADPYIYTLATQHIPEMIELIERLLEKGHAYVAEDGVYFRLSSFPEYGRLAGIKPEKLLEGASGRIDRDEYDKEAVGDFVLWKQAKPNEPYWYSPWGRGRPGWHIECSAMSMKYLGETLDISGGGEDNIFPHHDNSIAQSEAATGKPYVRYWMHVRHLMLNNEKMSKSLGNVLNVRDAVPRYGAMSLRLFLLSTHYRKPMNFIDSELARTQQRIMQLRQIISQLLVLATKNIAAQTNDKSLTKLVTKLEGQFRAAMENDFNTGLAINHLFQFLKQLQRYLEPSPSISSKTASQTLGTLQPILTILLGDLYHRELTQPPFIDVTPLVNLVLIERERLRDNKAFKRADEIRNALLKLGIEVTDTPSGPTWRLNKNLSPKSKSEN